MAYKSKKKQLAYMAAWRRKNSTYMREYYREKVRPLRIGKPMPKPADVRKLVWKLDAFEV